MIDAENKKTVLDDNAAIYKLTEDDSVSEKEKWASMSKSQRRQYFKDYYLKKLLAGIAVAALVISVIVTVARPRPDDVLSIAVINDYWDDDAEKTFSDELSKELKLEEGKQSIRIDDSFYFGNDEKEIVSPENASVFERFATYIMAGDINCLVMDKAKFEGLASAGYLLPVNEVMGGDLDKYKDRLFVAKTDDDKAEKIYGISLEGSEALKEVKAYQPDPVLAFAASAKEDDYKYLKTFAKRMLQIEKSN